MIQWIRKFFNIDEKQETPVVPTPVFTMIEPVPPQTEMPVIASIDPTKPVQIAGDLQVNGNLTVTGTTTTTHTDLLAAKPAKKRPSPKRRTKR